MIIDKWVDAKYRGIPCRFNLTRDELYTDNKFYSVLINVMIWVDVNILFTKEFPILIKNED